MKPFKKIAILFCVVAGIICFWLMPGINKATDTTYTRLYENTDATPSDTNRHVVRALPTKTVEVTTPKIQYKRERIRSKAKIKDITPKMFSRAVQFEPELEMAVVDSINQKKIITDSSKVIQ